MVVTMIVEKPTLKRAWWTWWPIEDEALKHSELKKHPLDGPTIASSLRLVNPTMTRWSFSSPIRWSMSSAHHNLCVEKNEAESEHCQISHVISFWGQSSWYKKDIPFELGGTSFFLQRIPGGLPTVPHGFLLKTETDRDLNWGTFTPAATWAMKKGAPGCLGYAGDQKLPTYIWGL